MDNCLIIALPRSGGTNLMKSIASAYKLNEGFEVYSSQNTLVRYPHMVYKDIVDHKPILYWVRESKKYERTVLLSRRDAIATAQSLYLIQHKRENRIDTKWSAKEIEGENISLLKRRIKRCQRFMILLSKRLSIPLNFYEDLYSENRLREKDIKLDLTFLNDNLKLRQDNLSESYI